MTAASTIVFEDFDVLAVAKPAGIAVIPARDEPPGESLHASLQLARGERLWVVHRIDRGTSGLVLFARNAESHRTLSMAFENRDVSKSYVAFTRPAPREATGVIAVALHTARKGKMRPALQNEADSLSATTRYTVEHVRDGVARVLVEPRTGRQHQIRVHLRSIDAPLLVDPLYARTTHVDAGALGVNSPAVDTLTLHALAIAFAHPRTGARLAMNAPLTGQLAALDAWIGQS